MRTEVRCELNALYESLAGRGSALNPEGQDRAVAVLPEVLDRQPVPLVRWQSRILDPPDFRVALQPQGQRHRVLAVPLETQAQRLKALPDRQPPVSARREFSEDLQAKTHEGRRTEPLPGPGLA